MTEAIKIAVLIFVSYTLVAVNTCALAKYLPTFISSVLFMCANFFLIRHVADAHTTAEFMGYLIGGVGGDLAGIYISKKAHIL